MVIAARRRLAVSEGVDQIDPPVPATRCGNRFRDRRSPGPSRRRITATVTVALRTRS